VISPDNSQVCIYYTGSSDEPGNVSEGYGLVYQGMVFNHSNGRGPAQAILDMGADASDMDIFHRGKLVFSRSIPIGGNNFMNGHGHGAARRISLERLEHEIQASLNYYERQDWCEKLEGLDLCGLFAPEQEIEAELENNLSLKVRHLAFKPLPNITCSRIVERHKRCNVTERD